MLKIDYLNNNEIFKNDVIACLNDWNNKTFEDEAITIIAINNHELVGFYQIKAHDNDNTNLSPWLANVYIVTQKRKMGYSRKLLKTISSVLKDLGYDSKTFSPYMIRNKISSCKSEFVLPDEYKTYVNKYEK